MIDLVKLRIGIEIEGKLQLYEDLQMVATGKKFTDPTQNEATVVITNLSDKTIDYIQKNTSPFTQKKQASRLTIEAGTVKKSYFLVFTGDIISSEISMPPDVKLTIRAKTNNANFAKVVVTNGKPIQKLSELVKVVATNNNLNLEFVAKDKNIANYSYSGTASKQIKDLQDTGGVNAFVDDKKLIVKEAKEPIKSRRRILNLNSGLVGVPKATEAGVQVTYLVDGESLLGGQITLESKFNKFLNGDYVIEGLEFNLENQGNNFFYKANCRRLNATTK